jgi:hypothetical protein
VPEHEHEQLFGPLRWRSLQQPAARGAEGALDVEQPTDLARVAADSGRGLVE